MSDFSLEKCLQPHAECDETLGMRMDLLKKFRRSGDHIAAAALARELAREATWGARSAVLIGQALAAVQAHAEAADFLDRQRRRHPMEASLHHNFGISLQALKRFPEALSAFRRAIEILPGSEMSMTSAGSVLRELGRTEEALEFHGAAVRLNPQNAHALYNLGNTLSAIKEYSAAENAYRKSLEIQPEMVECLNNLISSLFLQSKFKEAVPFLIKLNKLCSNQEKYLVLLIKALREVNQPLRALHFAELILQDHTPSAVNYSLAASCLSILGRADEAHAYYTKAIDLDPGNVTLHGPRIYTANYLNYSDPIELFEIHRAYGRLLEQNQEISRFFGCYRKRSGQRIRIGYVSGDFCKHPVTSFFLPVLEQHDRTAFEVFCYSNYVWEDSVTRRIRKLADHFEEIFKLSDGEFYEKIQKDKIDILVDLSGHTARSRLSVFAQKPAPIQVTMIGYMQTTGLKAVDYRITDAWLDPEGFSEHVHTEKLIRMDSGAICFQAPATSPDSCEPPCLSGKPFTFASFNNLAKVNDQVLDVWARVLLGLPQTRMRVIAIEAQFFLEKMRLRGVSAERFEILPRMQEYDYLEAHNGVDLILDTFPFNGLTVTMNALWMGVPCVTLKGNTSASRAGFALLDRVGLGEFAATNAEEFVRIATHWAQHPYGLASIRAMLRGRFSGAWTDAVRYTRELEKHFHAMWEAVPVAPSEAGGLPETNVGTTDFGYVLESSPQELVCQENAGQELGGRCLKASAVERLREELEVLRSNSVDSKAIAHAAQKIQAEPERAAALRDLGGQWAGLGWDWRVALMVGEIWHLVGDPAQAGIWMRHAWVGPEKGEHWFELALAWERIGGEREAMEALRMACSVEEPSPKAILLLANRCVAQTPADAEALYRKAISFSPSLWQAYLNLSLLLQKRGAIEAALTLAEYAVKLTEDSRPLLNLATCQNLTGRFSDGLQTLLRIPQGSGDAGAVYTGVGKSFWGLGRPAEAAGAFAKAIEIDPCERANHDNFLHILNHIPELPAETYFEKHREFSALFEKPLLRVLPFKNSRDPRKRLRIAYISPDLRTHSVSYFIEPILRAHRRSDFEVLGIFTSPWRDSITERLEKMCDQWLDAADWTDEELAQRLEQEQIDILVDLSCHSAGNRLLVFARKPAPVQITMIGMQQTTGLTSMDYRITDADMDPPGLTEGIHSEKLLRLKRAFVFQPPHSDVKVEPLPAREVGFITFGSFNNFAKTHPGVLEAWAAVLQRVPNSRLGAVVPEGAVFEEFFARAGIAPDRVFRMERQAGDDYLRMHHGVDIALDCFPFAGLTVSLFAAWMGVPTVTLAGKIPAARAGVSILRSLGLEDWVASDPADFIERAVAYASDWERLSEIRGSLRERMGRELSNRDAFIQDYEAQLRGAWSIWCVS